MNDPRLGLPSASSFSLDALCPGRQQLLREIGDTPEPIDEDAERGTRLHAAWEKEDPSGLDDEDQEIYGRGLKLVKQALDDWLNPFSRGGQIHVKEGEREERFYFHDSQGNVAASGQADRHYYSIRTAPSEKQEALVIDFKSLWCRSLAPAELNWQARLLSVLVAREYGATHVRFAFLKAMMGKADIVDYNAQDLERAQYSIQQILWEARQPNAQRRPGAHCRRCKAVAGCPEAAGWQMLPSVQAKAQSDAVTPKMAEQLVANISLLDCRKIWSGTTARHNIEQAVIGRLKGLSEPELAELGLVFGKAKVLKPITNVRSAYEFLTSVGVEPWSAMKFSNGELLNLVQEKLGLKKKEAERWIADKLGGCITPQTCERPLEEI